MGFGKGKLVKCGLVLRAVVSAGSDEGGAMRVISGGGEHVIPVA